MVTALDEWDDKRQEFKPHPLHDWSSHGADAFGYGVMGGDESLAELTPEYETEWVV